MAQERADVALARLARTQYGAFSRDQAIGKGLTEKQVQQRVDSRRWARVLPAVYRHAGTPPTEHLMLTAALLWSGERAVITGVSGARLWGVTDIEPVCASIIVPRDSRIRSNSLVHVSHSDARSAMQVSR